MNFRKWLAAYAPAWGGPLLAVIALIVVEVSESWDQNTLGYLTADGLAKGAVALSILTLVFSGIERLRAGNSSERFVSPLAEWAAIAAIALALIAQANVQESTGSGWAMFDAHASDRQRVCASRLLREWAT